MITKKVAETIFKSLDVASSSIPEHQIMEAYITITCLLNKNLIEMPDEIQPLKLKIDFS